MSGLPAFCLDPQAWQFRRRQWRPMLHGVKGPTWTSRCVLSRAFATERFCFRIATARWWPVSRQIRVVVRIRLNLNASFDVGLSFIRPTVRVDSLTRLVGTAATVTGIPCGKAKRRATCKAKYARAIATATPYGRSSCGRCPVASGTLALVYTHRDDVRVVMDQKAFLGSIDTAADAALWRDGTVVAGLDGGSWLVMRNEVDGTCDPFERAEVYERVRSDGRVEAFARLLVSRQFNVCA